MLHTLARELGVDLGVPSIERPAPTWRHWVSGTANAPPPPTCLRPRPHPTARQGDTRRLADAVDRGRLQDGEPHLAGTAHPAVARISAATAAAIGASGRRDADRGQRARNNQPAAGRHRDARRVVWLPLNSPGSAVHDDLRVTAGAVVRIEAGGSDDLSGPHRVRAGPVVADRRQGRRRLRLPAADRAGGDPRRTENCWAACRCGTAPTGWARWDSAIPADGIKLALKEGLVPAGDKPIYLLAPVISVFCAIMAFAVILLGPVVSVFGHRPRCS